MTLQIALSALPFLPPGQTALAETPLSPEADNGFAQLLAERSIAPGNSEATWFGSTVDTSPGKPVATVARMPTDMLNAAQRLRENMTMADSAASHCSFSPIRPVDAQWEPASTSDNERPRLAPADQSEIWPIHADRQVRAPLVVDAQKRWSPPASAPNVASGHLPKTFALAASIDQATSNADVREVADRKAAPLAIAFVAAGIFELPADDVAGLVTLSTVAASGAVRGSEEFPFARLSARPLPEMPRAISSAEGVEVPAGLPGSLWSSSRHMPIVTPWTAGSRATTSTVDDAPSAQRLPLNQLLMPVPKGAGALEAASADPVNAESRRNTNAHTQRTEFVASLLPVCVTLHAVGEGVKLTVRMASNQSGEDPAEFERMATKMLSSEGFDLKTVIMNGNQALGSRRNQ